MAFNPNFKIKVQAIGFLFFGILLYFAIHFYKERMLTYDSAGYCFGIEQTKDYCIPHGRWGNVFSQFLPLMALRSGASLVFFLKLYSASFIILYYLIFLICTLCFNDYKSGIALLLSQSLGFKWMFYYAISELLMGMAFSILLYAFVGALLKSDTKYRKALLYSLSLLLIITISYFHQLALFPALFILIFIIVSENRWKDKTIWSLLILAVIWSYIRIKVFSVADYEKGKILGFNEYYQQFFNLFQLPSWSYIMHYLTDFVPWLFYLMILCGILLIRTKRWLLLIYWLGFTAGYSILIALTYYKGESSLMQETYLPPIGLFTALVMLYIFYIPKREKYLIGITVWILFVSLRGMYYAGDFQVRRNDYLSRLTNYGNSLPNHKYLLNTKNMPVDILLVPWALSFETTLYSAVKSKDSTVTFAFTDSLPKYNYLLNDNNTFIGPEWRPNYPFKDDEHLSLPSMPYLIVNSSQVDTNFQTQRFNASNLKIEPVELISEVPYHKSGFVNIKITNTSGYKIHSLPDAEEPIMLSYRIYSLEGELIKTDIIKTPLEVDIYNEYTQAVKINSPSNTGDYIVLIDFITGNDKWWNCGGKIKLRIRGKSFWRWL